MSDDRPIYGPDFTPNHVAQAEQQRLAKQERPSLTPAIAADRAALF